jgi:hypothetical protein
VENEQQSSYEYEPPYFAADGKERARHFNLVIILNGLTLMGCTTKRAAFATIQITSFVTDIELLMAMGMQRFLR